MGLTFVISSRTRQTNKFAKALDRMDFKQHPDALRKAMIRSGKLVQQYIRDKHLVGPRPRKLDEVTGALARSIRLDKSELPTAIEIGTPLFWAEFHEFGLGRFRKRPFVVPAMEEALELVPDIFVEEWKRQVYGV